MNDPLSNLDSAAGRINDVKNRLTGVVQDPFINDLEFAERDLRDVREVLSETIFKTDQPLDLSTNASNVVLNSLEAEAINDILQDFFGCLRERDPHVWEGQSNGEILVDLLQDAHKMTLEDATAFMFKLGFDT